MVTCHGKEKGEQLASSVTKADQRLALVLKVKSHLYLMGVWKERGWRTLLSPGNRNLLAQGIAADSQFLNLVAESIIIKSIM